LRVGHEDAGKIVIIAFVIRYCTVAGGAEADAIIIIINTCVVLDCAIIGFVKMDAEAVYSI